VTGPHDAERRERKRLGRPVCIRGRGRCEYYSTIFTFAPSSTAGGDLGVRSDWFATATRTEASGPTRSDRARSDLAMAEPSPWHSHRRRSAEAGDARVGLNFTRATLCIEGTLKARLHWYGPFVRRPRAPLATLAVQKVGSCGGETIQVKVSR
jgi:hypothetical protein